MEKAYLFLRKLVALGLNLLIFFLVKDIVSVFISIPVLLLVFAFIVSRISTERPKELFNYKHSENYFAKGGLRDLLRIPQILFGFTHDLVVWEIWGLYQIFLLFTEIVYFLKQIVFWIIHAFIWVLKHFFPFWKIVYKMFLLYVVKWVWWIYRYSFTSLKKAYNWNMLKVSIIGSFLALFIFHLFYFLEITLDIFGLKYIGVVLALLPATWVFGEIASIRGQKLMFVPFHEVRLKMRNGLESVRGLLFFITFFVVILIAQAGLALLGWISGSGIALLGFSLNISFLFNIVLLLLAIIIFFGSFVLPTYRLYNEFSETSFVNVYKLFIHIVKRSLQYLVGFIPSSFFAAIAILPSALLVGLAFYFTMQVKDNIASIKISKLQTEQALATTQLENYKLVKQIDNLESVTLFPKQYFQDINHKELIKKELDLYKKQKDQQNLQLASFQDETNKLVANLNTAIKDETSKSVINQTRLEEYQQALDLTQKKYAKYEATAQNEIALLEVDIDYTHKRLKQLPLLFYLSGLLTVVVFTLVLAFALSYFGNFFYRAFLFRNDGTPSEWKGFIHAEKEISKNQPLLSTTLNVILILVLIFLFSDISISTFLQNIAFLF